jgi:hypothetical protein
VWRPLVFCGGHRSQLRFSCAMIPLARIDALSAGPPELAHKGSHSLPLPLAAIRITYRAQRTVRAVVPRDLRLSSP